MENVKRILGFHGSSAGKESAYNGGDPSLIPGSGRSPGEWIGYQLQHSWASLVAQMVKNPPAVQETWAQSLDWEDPLKEGIATQSIVLSWRIPMDRGGWWATVLGVTKNQTHESKHTYTHKRILKTDKTQSAVKNLFFFSSNSVFPISQPRSEVILEF